MGVTLKGETVVVVGMCVDVGDVFDHGWHRLVANETLVEAFG